MIGRIIPDYRIKEKIGEWGVGVVYNAHDTHLDRSAAIKLLRTKKVSDPDRKRRFVRGAIKAKFTASATA